VVPLRGRVDRTGTFADRVRAVHETTLESFANAMPFAELGITVTVDQFNNLARYTPAFQARLREWSLDSDAAIGSLESLLELSERQLAAYA
jgi:hypothetical protein